jgi:hypothetical protein
MDSFIDELTIDTTNIHKDLLAFLKINPLDQSVPNPIIGTTSIRYNITIPAKQTALVYKRFKK